MPSSAAIGCVNRSGKKPTLLFDQILSNKRMTLDNNSFVVSNVDRIKDIFQRIRHYKSAQSIFKSLKCTSKSILLYTLYALYALYAL